MQKKETLILNGLIANAEYCRKVLPHLEKEFFETPSENVIFGIVYNFFEKYKKQPTKEAIYIELMNSKAPEKLFEECDQTISEIVSVTGKNDLSWLVDMTEAWARRQKLYNAMKDGIAALEDEDTTPFGEVIEKLQEAVGFSFTNQIGHDFFEDAAARYEHYTRKDHKIPFGVTLMNKITAGGVSEKTFNLLLAGTHIGKTLAMCSFSADNLRDGKNVLYITNEVSEQEIAKRHDANLLDVSLDEIADMPQSLFERKIEAARRQCLGNLVVKEYPTGAASALHFDYLIDELETKKKFKPDVVYVDYLNICSSSRMKDASNSYRYVGSIAMELRGLAVQRGLPVWSATQLNRESFKKSDFDADAVSESFAVPMHADFMLGLTSTEEFRENGWIRARQIKNRYADLFKCPSFLMNIDYGKQRISDADESVQKKVTGYKSPPKIEDEISVDDIPLFDRTGFAMKDFSSLMA